MPLARALWLQRDADPPTLVAALPWSDFQELRTFLFEVLCRRANDRFEISAVGHQAPAAFPPQGTPQILQALVVEVKDLPSSTDLPGLTPGGLYLVTYQPPAIDTIDDEALFRRGGPP